MHQCATARVDMEGPWSLRKAHHYATADDDGTPSLEQATAVTPVTMLGGFDSVRVKQPEYTMV